MQRKVYNLTDQKFGRLTVISEAEPQQGKRQKRWMWNCSCTCGANLPIRQDALLDGTSQSCGCWTRERSSETHKRHGLTHTTEYLAWCNMKRRCIAPLHTTRYADRGITICEGWLHDFAIFFADVGLRPSPKHSLDRKDNDGNYSCGHCSQCLANEWPLNARWVTPDVQARNKRSNRLLTLDGVTMPMTDWADQQGMSAKTLQGRLDRGWSVQDALLSPVQHSLSRVK